MATGEKGPATGIEPGTYTLSQSFSHELPVPATKPSSPIALCWSFSPCRHPPEQWIPGIITALATPAHTEPAQAKHCCMVSTVCPTHAVITKYMDFYAGISIMVYTVCHTMYSSSIWSCH